MVSDSLKSKLEKQQYRVVGSHSVVKVCHWCKSAIKGQGSCYKHKFYGIKSHQCLQMSPSLSCANRCVYCWRDHKDPVCMEWKGIVDSPEEIIEQAIIQHKKLNIGLKGYKDVDKKVFEQSQNIRHVALSLTGEPIVYPKISELINLFHKQKISTFLVTNGQYPELIKSLASVTQLYLSMDAPSKELAKRTGIPLFADFWERFNQSLEELSKKTGRTCIRLTMIKDVNMIEPEVYARLIKKASPGFIEVKAYMHVGASRERLEKKNMPSQKEIMNFSKKLLHHLTDYDIASDHYASRVVLLAKKSFKKNNEWHTWIDFEKFFSLENSGKDFSSDEYSAKTPDKFIGLETCFPKNSIDESDMAENESK